MNILGVYLKNVRSYVDETIVFPNTGITCIYGDVGAGKTSILMAISFALFGTQARGDNPIEAYSYPKPEDLLRVGTNRGVVRLAFIHRGKIYLVERTIERVGDKVSDKGGFIKSYRLDTGGLIREATHKLSSEELKNRVLEILGLTDMYHGIVKEKKPYLYTMVMYIPQLNVYEVLSLDDEKRRKVVNASLGLERYINIDKNVDELVKFINDNYVKPLEAKEKTLIEQLKMFNRSELERRLEAVKDKLSKVQGEIAELEERRKILVAKLDELRSMEEDLVKQASSLRSQYEVKRSKLSEAELKRKRLMELYSNVTGIDVEKIGDEITSVESLIGGTIEEIKRVDKMLDEISLKINEKSSLKRELIGILRVKEEQASILSEKLNNVVRLVEKGVCPTCGQEITKNHGEKLINEHRELMESIRNEINVLHGRIAELESEINVLESERRDVSKQLEDLEKKLEDLNRKKERLVNLKQIVNLIEQLKDDVLRLEKEASGVEIIESRIKEIENKLHSIRVMMKESEAERRRVEEEVAKLVEMKGSLDGEMKSIKEKINLCIEITKRYGEVLNEKNKALSYINFLKEFGSLAKDIEMYVKSRVIESFRQVFRKYFMALIEGSEFIDVDMDADLTPIVKVTSTRGEFEVSQPSGGQITALSLAYRLALNTLFRTLHNEFRDAVLILDEPTIGFSVERVEKLRELLKSFGGEKQVIVVTHDRNLLDIGDCRIRLDIDGSYRSVETRVVYEDCLCRDIEWGNYRRMVEDILNLRT